MKACSAQNNLRRSSARLCAILFAFIPLHAPAQIFECIDAGGNIEFAQKCSPGTVKKREVAKTAGGDVNKGDPPRTSYKDEEHAFQQRRLEREANEEKAKAAAARVAKNCQTARSQLHSIEHARRVTGSTDPKTGERRYLDDNERAAATQKARDAVASYCK